MASGIVSFKVYLIENGAESEIRRFGHEAHEATSYGSFVGRIMEVFPGLEAKQFKIYWIDDDGDHVAVSSDSELLIALTTMKSDVKKFYVRAEPPSGAPEGEILAPHPGVYCDGCNADIVGFRYKCLKCRNYDLCRSCEHAGVHPEHPLLRIPHALCFDRFNLMKLTEFIASTIPVRVSGHRSRHSHEGGHSDSHKKKKRSDRRDSGPDTGDEMDDGCHRKHSHKKCRKQSACPFGQMFDPFSPRQDWSEETSRKSQKDTTSHMAYLKSVGSAIQKLLDPLGVNVEFEVRNGKKAEEKKEEEKKKEEEEKKAEEKKKAEEEKKEEKAGPTPAPSAPPQFEVRFASPQEMAQTVKQGIEEITKILASQTMGNNNNSNSGSRTSPDNDGWVSFEELKKESEEPEPESSAPRESVPEPEKEAKPSTSSETAQNLYPDLTTQHVSPEVREALEKMLAMGFTNEGNWLTHLLEAKRGDINQALEVLAPHKKK